MNWLQRIVSRRSLYRDLSDEIRTHLEEKIDELTAQGMNRRDAEYLARREFGNINLTERDARETWRWSSLENLGADIRFGLRMLRKAPGAAFASILVLSLGFCVCASIFAFVDAALLKPLPYAAPTRLVGVYETAAMIPRSYLSYPDYLDWKKLNTSFSSLEAWGGDTLLLKTSSGAVPVPVTTVSSGFFRMLGVSPLLGRDFSAGEDSPGARAVVMLTYAGWQNWFSGSPDVIGRNVDIGGEPYTVIAVLPKEFQFAPRGKGLLYANIRPTSSCETHRSCHDLFGIARLKDGVSIETASAEMKGIARRLEQQYPDSNGGQGAEVVSLTEAIIGSVKPTLVVLLIGAGLLMLIACANVSSLLVVRVESRRREIAVRAALGASRSRLMCQFVSEGLLLVIAGMTLGLLGAAWSMQWLLSLIPADFLLSMPYLTGLGLHARVLLFIGALALLATLLFSLSPNLRLSLHAVHDGLLEGGRGSASRTWRQLGSKLVVVELAVAMVLLAGAGVLGKSFYRLLQVPLGFQENHLAVLDAEAPDATYQKPEAQVALLRRVEDRISHLPGVQSVGLTHRMVLTGNGMTSWIRIVGRPYHNEHHEVNDRHVSAGYFTALQARLLRGRFFTDAEDTTKPLVAIINEAFAERYFPGEDPIGQKVGDYSLSPNSIKQVVGVVENVKEGTLEEDIWPAIYEPFNQHPDTFFGVIVRTAGSERAMLPELAATLREVDSGIGTMRESTMRQRVADSPSVYLHRSAAWLVAGFASLALLLSIVGLYGVIAYSVSQRTREIGVRMALGANRSIVRGQVLREGMLLALAGLALGLGASYFAGRTLQALLFQVSAVDPSVVAGVAAVLLTTSAIACYLPAKRATQVDPMVALRHE